MGQVVVREYSQGTVFHRRQGYGKWRGKEALGNGVVSRWKVLGSLAWKQQEPVVGARKRGEQKGVGGLWQWE